MYWQQKSADATHLRDYTLDALQMTRTDTFRTYKLSSLQACLLRLRERYTRKMQHLASIEH